MATIEERKTAGGKIKYRVKIRKKGNLVVTETFSRKTDAKRWAQQVEAAMDEGRYVRTAQSRKHTVGELIDRYIQQVLPKKPKSEKKQGAQLLWWKEQIGHYLLSDIDAPHIVEQRDNLLNGITVRGTKRSPSTVVRYMAALSHVFRIAVQEWGWMDDTPMRKVSKPSEPAGRVRYLDTDERSRLLSACKESNNSYLYTVVVLALATGMRQGELMGLTWDVVDLVQGRILLNETKNGERRSIPVSGHALDCLCQLEKKRRIDTNLLFPAQKVQKPQKPVNLRIPWETALKKAEIVDFRFHDLRHSTGSYLAMSGATSVEIAAVLGHKTLQMVKRYSHVSDNHAAHVLKKMNDGLFALGE